MLKEHGVNCPATNLSHVFFDVTKDKGEYKIVAGGLAFWAKEIIRSYGFHWTEPETDAPKKKWVLVGDTKKTKNTIKALKLDGAVVWECKNDTRIRTL